MSQNNNSLNLAGIKDKNIEIQTVNEKHYWKNGEKRNLIEINAKLSYRITNCPFCNSSKVIKNGTKLTKIKLGILIGHPATIFLKKQRFLCKNCHSTSIAKTSLVEKYHSIARNITNQIHLLAQHSLTVKVIGEILGISSNSIERRLYKDKKALMPQKKLPRNICFDEFRSVNSQFSFIAIDAESHNFTTLLDSRLNREIVKYYKSQYSISERKKVETVTIDLNAQYQVVIRQIFPNAKIIIDRFHLVQLIGRALDQERLRVLHEIDDVHNRVYKSLKSHWRLIHLNENKLDDRKRRYFRGINEYITPRELVDLGLNYDAKLNYVYDVYQSLLIGIDTGNVKLIKETLNDYRRVNSPMDTAINTLKKNLKSVENSCNYPYSNGPLEGIIRKIKTIKRNCYGFKRMDHLFIRIQLIHA